MIFFGLIIPSKIKSSILSSINGSFLFDKVFSSFFPISSSFLSYFSSFGSSLFFWFINSWLSSSICVGNISKSSFFSIIISFILFCFNISKYPLFCISFSGFFFSSSFKLLMDFLSLINSGSFFSFGLIFIFSVFCITLSFFREYFVLNFILLLLSLSLSLSL